MLAQAKESETISGPSAPGFLHSLTGRLFKLVFGGYLLLAITVTAVQLLLEYRSINHAISGDLTALGSSFEKTATDALWKLDRPLLESMAQGIHQSPIVTGVKIVSDQGEVLAQSGRLPADTQVPSSGLLAPYQRQQNPLNKITPRGEQRLGDLILYSDRAVAIDRVQYSFLVILINSLIKTLGLWLIFYLVVTRGLAKPIGQLTDVVSKLEFAVNTPEPISLDYLHDDELGRLMTAMQTMQARLFNARKELDEINQNLELTLVEREQELKIAYEKLTNIEIERAKIKHRESLLRDVHDGFGSQLSSARLRAQKGKMSQSEMEEILGECISDLYLVVDTLKNVEGNLGDALRYLRNRSQRRLAATGLELVWRFNLDDDSVMPHPRIMSILRIVQEALNNAIKYSQATQITIEAKEHANQILIKVQDNGIGITAGEPAGKGLENMQIRAEELGGAISITRAEPGTLVALTVPTEVASPTIS